MSKIPCHRIRSQLFWDGFDLFDRNFFQAWNSSMHVGKTFVGAGQKGEVEAAIVFELANDPGAISHNLDRGGSIGKPFVLQTRPRPAENDALASETHFRTEGDRSLTNFFRSENSFVKRFLVIAFHRFAANGDSGWKCRVVFSRHNNGAAQVEELESVFCQRVLVELFARVVEVNVLQDDVL